MKKGVLIALFLILSAYVSTAQEASLKLLSDWMTGTFSSEDQALADTSYFSISLHIYPLSPKGTDGIWLYVEQAMASKLDKPYRQRVYCLTAKADSTFQSSIFTLNDPLRFAGKPELVSALPSDSLVPRHGCEVVLAWNAEKSCFAGSTGANSCPSDLRGASYATSEVELYADRMLSWDRGFNPEGKQVWGAENGGYIFRKKR